MTKPMISISGVRGIVDNKQDRELFYETLQEFVSGFAVLVKKNKGAVVVGRDTRKSGSEILNTIVVPCLTKFGLDVIDLGVVSTPTVEILVKELKAAGGIIITASHNPSNWNALKFIGNKGMFLTQLEFNELLDIVKKKDFKSTGNGIVQLKKDANEIHIKHICSKIDVNKIKNKKFKVILDSCNGAGSVITQQLLKQLGCEVVAINCDIDKDFPRSPEPSIENLSETIAFAKKYQADICFVQDPDADRLAVISDKGVYIGEEYSLVLSAMDVLNKKKGDIVVNVSTSMMIDEIAKKYKVKVFRTKVGEINVSEKMEKIRAVFGGEGNGGVICPKFHYGRDSLVGIALILSLMAETNKTISELVAEIPAFIMKKEKVHVDKQEFLAKENDIRKVFKGCVIDETDGLKFAWEDKWIQVRASNTEPIIRIMAEAKTEKEAEDLVGSVRELFRERNRS